MIDGVTVLATNVVTMTNPVMNAIFITLGIIAGLGFLLFILGLITDCLGIGATGGISLITAFILFLFVFLLMAQHKFQTIILMK